MMLPLILFGFAMLTLGFAMLCIGEVPFLRGKRIPALRSRIIGGVLVSFLPALWGLRLLVGSLVGTDSLSGPIFAWALFLAYGLVIFAMVFRILYPRHEPRVSSIALVGDDVPFVDEPNPSPTQSRPPAKSPTKPAAEDDNPFHFS